MTRLVFFPPELALALSPFWLAQLQERFGGLDGVDLADPLAVARALFAREVPVALADALDEIARLATALGREAVLEGCAGRVEADEVRALAAVTPVALATRFVVRAHAGHEVAKQALRRARKRLGRLVAGRATYEMGALPVESDAREAIALAAAREVHGDGVVAAWAVRAPGGVVHVAVVHRGPAEDAVAERRGRVTRGVHRPLTCDTVLWEDGRVSLDLARPTQLEAWTAAIAQGAGDTARRVADRPAFTLKLLHERGAKWSRGARLPDAIKSVAAVACELDDGARFAVRGAGALAAMHARIGRGGYLYRTTLRFVLAEHGGVDEVVDATIELPGKLVVSVPRWRHVVREAVRALGLSGAGAIPDDLVALAPFVHADWRWIEVLSRESFQRAVRDGVLVPARSSRAGEARHRRYGSMYVVHDLPGETTKYAVADDWALPAHDVAVEATMRWRLDVARLALVLRERMTLGAANVSGAPKGLVPVGALDAKGARLVYFLLLRAVSKSERGRIARQLRRACKGALPVVITSGDRTLGGAVAEVRVSAAEHVGGAGIERAVVVGAQDAGVADGIDGWRWGSEGEPLVVLALRDEVWLHRVLLALTENERDFFLGLAKDAGGWVSSAELGRRIAATATIPDQVVRRIRMGLPRKIVKSFAEAGVALPAGLVDRLVEHEKTRGYRLGVGVVVVTQDAHVSAHENAPKLRSRDAKLG